MAIESCGKLTNSIALCSNPFSRSRNVDPTPRLPKTDGRVTTSWLGEVDKRTLEVIFIMRRCSIDFLPLSHIIEGGSAFAIVVLLKNFMWS
jgi:hypothetical protein